MKPRGVVRFLVCGLALSASALQAQFQVRDPHVPAPERVPGPEEFIVIDDMLLYPEQLDVDERSRPQALIIDYRQPLGAWDSGVIPYQISQDFPDVERQRILAAFTQWMSIAPVVFVPRTTQIGHLTITRDAATAAQATPCFSNVGQSRRAAVVRTNLGVGCSGAGTIAHEFGHALGLWHEHQRADRDQYLSIDFDNIPANARGNFNIMTALPLVGEYDFGSIMHYSQRAFAIDTSRPTIIPHAPYASWAPRMGGASAPSDLDHGGVAFLYNQQLRESIIRKPTESVRTRFDRTDVLLAMERLHAFYMSRYGLQRPQGLAIDGRPDFLGIAQWIFGVYLGARSGGYSTEGAFDIVVGTITESDEWRQKNRTRAPLTPASYSAYISFSADEFREVLNRLDGFYRAPEGLQRPEGLSISGGPDFLGIAAWLFDVYLNERLNGISSNAAWTVVENAIRATDEWRRKH